MPTGKEIPFTLAEPAQLEVRRADIAVSGAYEVWTSRSVYRLDGELRCITVEGAQDGMPRENHRCCGAILAGTRAEVDGRMSVVSSLPPPGTNAIFANQDMTVTVTTRVQRLVKNVPS